MLGSHLITWDFLNIWVLPISLRLPYRSGCWLPAGLSLPFLEGIHLAAKLWQRILMSKSSSSEFCWAEEGTWEKPSSSEL